MNEEDASQSDDPRVFAAVQDYLAELEAGRRPSRREFLARHREIAAELGACLDGLAFVHSAAGKIDADISGGPSKAIDPDLAQPLGDFRLIREIGRGGMGAVYEAVQLSLGRRVALKILPMAAALDSRHLERFRNEASAAAQLHHTNIVPVYAVGCERSVHFYAMQLIEGQSLEDVIRDLRQIADPAGATRDAESITAREMQTVRVSRYGKPVPSPAASSTSSVIATATSGNLSALRTSRRGTAYARSVASIGLQVAEALDYAHRAGVVHRDVKPANLLLDAKGTVWITDFGLALFYADTGLTRSGDLVGTLRYMSPEQASGRAVVLDQRTDIYSLGVTLYELLTLERAHDGATHERLLYQVAYEDPKSPRSMDRTIPREMEVILGKAMAKEPADRYPSAQAMADDLRRFLKDEPILARPPSVFDQVWKWTRRHKAWAFSGVAIITLAAAALLVSTLLIAREQAKTNAAYISERKQHALAQQSWSNARQAVDFFSGIAIAMDRPQYAEVRRDMLDESLAYYQSFLDSRRGDPSVSAELAAAQARVSSYLELYAALDSAVRAQERLSLLQEQSVRDDLKLDPVRAMAARKVVDQFGVESGGFGRPAGAGQIRFPTTTDATQDTRRYTFAAQAHQIQAAIEQAIGPIAAARLEQISRQVRAPASFSDPDVVQALSLSREQSAEIRNLRVQFRGENAGPPEERRPDRRIEVVNEIVAKLTPAQAGAWNHLIGATFQGHVRMRGPGQEGPPAQGDHRGPDGPPGPEGGFDFPPP